MSAYDPDIAIHIHPHSSTDMSGLPCIVHDLWVSGQHGMRLLNTTADDYPELVAKAVAASVELELLRLLKGLKRR